MEVFKEIADHQRFAAEKMQKVNLFDTERMFCDVYCFEAGQEQTAHAHKSSDKIYYVLEGKALIRVVQRPRTQPWRDCLSSSRRGAWSAQSRTGAPDAACLMTPKP